MKKIVIVIFGILLLSMTPLYSQFTRQSPIYKALLNPKYIIMPGFSYSTETNAVFALGVYFNPGVVDKSSNYFTLDTTAKYSLKEQFELRLRPAYKFGNWRIQSEAKFRKWPDTYYGIGNNTDKDISEEYTTNKYIFGLVLSRYFSEQFAIGIGANWQHYDYPKNDEEGNLILHTIPGSETSEVAGLGGLLELDSTDGPYYPYSGIRFKLSAYKYLRETYGDYDFERYSIDLRTYSTIANNTVVANQFEFESNQGDVPFYMMSKLGDQLRAYSSNRFIDKNRISFRTESRFLFPKETILYPFGYVIFAETGLVAPSIEDIASDDLKYSVGTGLRYTIIEKNKFNFQCDVAWGDEGYEIKIGGKEEF